MAQEQTIPKETCDRLARRTLFGFIVTFVLARTIVFLIMSHAIPNMYFFLQGTHVHHLNYGIFLLAGVAGYVLFARPEGREAELAALLYGVAMALTFDEFGMWLHLGGSYWQRASVDAVIVVAAMIALLSYAPSLERLESHHIKAFVILIVAVIGFGFVIYATGSRVGNLYGPQLHDLELSSSP